MNKFKTFLPIVLLFITCQSKQNLDESNDIPYYGDIKIIEVPRDSISKPEVRLIDPTEMKTVPARKPKVHPLRKFDNLAGQFQPIIVDDPQVFTPGQDTFSLPKIVEAVEKFNVAGTPKVVAAKDPTSKDDNPFGFLAFAKKQGLNDSRIQDIKEDKHGNLWFGTFGRGISKYDGRNITSFTTQEGLSTDYISSIFEDSKGNIWLGSAIGLIGYDGNFFKTFETNDSILGEIVWEITEDPSGNLWLGSGGGLIKYDGKTFSIYSKAQGLRANAVRRIKTDSQGNIWMTINSIITKFDGTSFYHYNLGKDHTRFFHSISEDNEGNMWFGCNKGAIKFDGSDFSYISSNEGLHSNELTSIYQDQNNNIWFGSYDNGLAKYDGEKFIHYSTAFGFPHENVRKILEDKTGNLWLATGAGIVKFTGNAFSHFSVKDGLDIHNYIYSMTADNYGNIWLGTNRKGIWKYDGSSFLEFTMDQGLRMNEVPNILKDKKGNLWIGDFTCNITKFDGSTFTNFPVIPNSGHCHINSMFEDKAGNIWISTGYGALKYNGESITHFTDKNGLSDNAVNNILEDNSGNIWFSTIKGVTMYDGEDFKHFTKQDTIEFDFISNLAEDQYLNIWIGTPNDGVYRYDGTSFMHFTTKEGLAANDISSILEDKSGNIWFGTSNGLSMLDHGKVLKLNELGSKIASGKTSFTSDDKIDILFKHYKFDDGFLGIGVNLGTPTMLEDHEGNIWVAANDRLTVIHPEGIKYNSIPPNIQISSIELFNEQIAWGKLINKKDSILTLGNGVKVKSYKFDDLSTWYGLPENLSLASNNNFITFNFIGITMTQSDRIMYQYKLEGIDENWSSLTSNSSANYGSLPDGHFTFLVKALNSDGVWSDTIKYEFEIRPPWWRTWWAYTIFAILMLSGLYAFIQFRTRKLKMDKVLLEKTVNTRTAELKNSLENLKSTQAQLIQAEKMASLGELTAGIAHEIQNPLNFVTNFSEVSVELIDEMQAELSKGEVEEVKAISIDLRSNLEKINHHGKRADSIVKGMLEHSRTSSGERVPTDMNALCDEYLRLSYHGLRAKDKSFNAAFETNFDLNLPKINVVPQDIGRVLLNLINNAFYAVKTQDHTSPHETEYKPAVIVSTKNLGDRMEISVKDNGNGIPDHIKDKIFQPFFTTKPTGQGTGLGLSLSYDIVKSHGGELKVETKEGEGSVFFIQLPFG